MRHVLDIDYPVAKMEASRKRMAARGTFSYADRVPRNWAGTSWPQSARDPQGLAEADFGK